MSEDTLTPRNETIPGLVELVTLNVGDEFQAGDTGGTVVWKVNKGSAKAVDVLYDGHTKPISIAPSLKVMVRKLKEERTVVTFEEANRACDELQAMVECYWGDSEEVRIPNIVCEGCSGPTCSAEVGTCESCGSQFCEKCIDNCLVVVNTVFLCSDCNTPGDNIPVVGEGKFGSIMSEPWQDNSGTVFSKEDLENAAALPAPEDATKVVLTDEETGVQETCWVVPPAPTVADILSLRTGHDKGFPAPKPIPSPTIRVVRLTADEPKTMPVMVQPPLPTCKFDLTLTPEQIRLLTFDSVKQMFYKGLYFGWTRETFFEVAKAKFPHLKAGQNYESCLAQIRLYHCALKNAGRMQ